MESRARSSETEHLTKGQQAMALAMIYPEPEKGGRGKKSQRVEETSTVSGKRLQQARAVLRFSRPMAEAVLKGTDSVDEALNAAARKAQETCGFSEQGTDHDRHDRP